MRLIALFLLAACATAAPQTVPPRPPREDIGRPRSKIDAESATFVQALREEYRAMGRIQAVLGWYVATQGETSLNQLTYIGHDRLFQRTALDAIGRAQGTAQGNDALALTFLKRTLTGEIVGLSVARFDDEYSDAEASATVTLPWIDKPVAFRNVQNLIAQEPDAARRREAFAAMNAVRVKTLNPILERKEDAAQKTARDTGFADYVALSEDLRQVQLAPLLAQGVQYVEATEDVFRATLDRVAHEELGISREQMHQPDWGRLWKSPRLSPYFDKTLELKTLDTFLSGIGLTLGEVKIDDSLNPRKRPRAFVNPVDPPRDVRLSVKPVGGLDDYWTLFHEAGHAVHFASSTIEPSELIQLGYGAPTEGFGEFFRHAFSDPHWLTRFRTFLHANGKPAPGNAELSAILRRTALIEMYYLRRYAFAKIAYELRLHGRPASEIEPALKLLPGHPDDLHELYRELFSRAYGFTLSSDDAQVFRTDVDDTFYSADYARAFVLAGLMHEGIRRQFGDDWYGDPAVGKFLKTELFSKGTALSADEIARKLGFSGLDFGAAAARARRLVAEADALEKAK
ncbi:MAG: hypothetical protein LC689_23135 [Myxococcales bacterium]|nr:hypothetical protein [Myxococcales bacterium]